MLRVEQVSTEAETEDCVIVWLEMIAFTHRTLTPPLHPLPVYTLHSDNKGPHDFKTASAIFDAVEKIFPGAEVTSSDAFDDFVEDVWPHSGTLPVVTAEIGDTWIFGASTDPVKVAMYRAASRLRAACVTEGRCTADKEPKLADFERLLIKVSEHTWGWNDGSLRTPKDYSNKALASKLASDKQYQTAVLTWLEQRSFVPNAVRALGNGSALGKAIQEEFAAMTPTGSFDNTGFKDAASLSTVIACGSEPASAVHVGFDVTGAITTLRRGGNSGGSSGGSSDDSSGSRDGAVHDWASPSNPIARVWYNNMDDAYYKEWNAEYVLVKQTEHGRIHP